MSQPSDPSSPAPPEPAATDRPGPAKEPARTTLGARPRDMLISMLILLPIIGLLAFLGRGCSFSPGGPTVDPSRLPGIDAHGALSAAARATPFAVREPVVPAGWRANAVDQRPAPGGAKAVRIGWVTDGGRYLRLVQSTAEEAALVTAEAGGPPTGAGPLSVAGAPWVAYTGGNGEQAWTRREDGVQLVVTGDGVPAEFRTLAEAVSVAKPLPKG